MIKPVFCSSQIRHIAAHQPRIGARLDLFIHFDFDSLTLVMDQLRRTYNSWYLSNCATSVMGQGEKLALYKK